MCGCIDLFGVSHTARVVCETPVGVRFDLVPNLLCLEVVFGSSNSTRKKNTKLEFLL